MTPKAHFEARPDQIQDLAYFINNPKAGLLHDPGVGKTITAALYTQYSWSHLHHKSVWIQTSSLLEKNRAEILRFTNFLPHEVVIIRGTPAKRLKLMEQPNAKVFLFTADGWCAEYFLLLKRHPDVKTMFCDEFHLYFGNHKSKRTGNWYISCRGMQAVIPMTGTLLRGKLSNAYPMLHVIAPQYYGTYEAFIAQHALLDEYGNVSLWTNHEKLKNVLGACCIRRSFESIYGPEKPAIQMEQCQMSPLQRLKYDELQEHALLELEDQFLEAKTGGAVSLRCRQIMAHPEAVKLPIAWDEEGKPTVFHTYNLLGAAETTGKDEALLIHIQEHLDSGERLLIFAVFVSEQERIVKMIQQLGGKAELINGNVAGKERSQIDRNFCEGKTQFVVGSAVTMGVGFNWPFLNTIIFSSIDYGDDSFSQAYKRGIRGKRDKTLRVIVLEYEDSLDQRIFKIVERKAKDFALVDETREEIFLSQKKSEPLPDTKSVKNSLFARSFF